VSFLDSCFCRARSAQLSLTAEAQSSTALGAEFSGLSLDMESGRRALLKGLLRVDWHKFTLD
jgi:hypothetical protein